MQTGVELNIIIYNNGYLCHIDIKMIRKFKMHSVMCVVRVIV